MFERFTEKAIKVIIKKEIIQKTFRTLRRRLTRFAICHKAITFLQNP